MGDREPSAASARIDLADEPEFELGGLRVKPAERSVELTPLRIAIVAASIATAVGGLGLALLGCLALGARAAPRFPAAVLSVIGIVPAYLAVQSLFSGGFVRDLPGIGWIKAGVAVTLVASIPIAGGAAMRTTKASLPAPSRLKALGVVGKSGPLVPAAMTEPSARAASAFTESGPNPPRYVEYETLVALALNPTMNASEQATLRNGSHDGPPLRM